MKICKKMFLVLPLLVLIGCSDVSTVKDSGVYVLENGVKYELVMITRMSVNEPTRRIVEFGKRGPDGTITLYYCKPETYLTSKGIVTRDKDCSITKIVELAEAND